MAKELILLPKIKYEQMLERLAAPVNLHEKDDAEIKEPLEPLKDDNLDNPDNLKITNNGRFQEGKGFIVKTDDIGKPPGKSKQKRRSKVKWMIY